MLKKGKTYLDELALCIEVYSFEKISIVNRETPCKVRKHDDHHKKCHICPGRARKTAIFYENGSCGWMYLQTF